MVVTQEVQVGSSLVCDLPMEIHGLLESLSHQILLTRYLKHC